MLVKILEHYMLYTVKSQSLLGPTQSGYIIEQATFQDNCFEAQMLYLKPHLIYINLVSL